MAPPEWSALTVRLCTPLRLATDVLGAWQGLLFSSVAQSTSFKCKDIVFEAAISPYLISSDYTQNFPSFVVLRKPYFCVFQRYV